MKSALIATACLLATSLALAAEIKVTVNTAEKTGDGAAVGSVRIVETPYGLAF